MPKPSEPKGTTEFAALSDALETYRPPCHADDRYTADDLTPATLAELQAGCDLCHIRTLCAAYARAARPKIGVWAGNHYKGRTAHTTKGQDA